MMHFYTYKIIKNDTGHFYLGKRIFRGKDPHCDKYFGSGTIIRRMVAKHGKDAFTKTIISFYPDKDSLNQAEVHLISNDVLNDPLCLNLALGGAVSWQNLNHSPKAKAHFLEVVRSDNYRRNMSEKINSPEVKSKMINSIKATMSTEEWKSKHSKTQSEVQNRPEERERNSNAQKLAQNRKEVRTKKSLAQRAAFNNPDTRMKHSASLSNRTRINNGTTTKNVKVDELQQYLDSGWEYGTHYKNHNPVPRLPYLTVRDGETSERVRIDRIQDKLDAGWTLTAKAAHKYITLSKQLVT